MHGYAHTTLRTTVVCHPNMVHPWAFTLQHTWVNEMWIRLIPAQGKATSRCHFYNYFLDCNLKSITTDGSSVAFLQYLRTKKETSIQKIRTETGYKYFPAPCSITKTEKPLDPTRIRIPADPFLPALLYLNPQYLLNSPCSQAFGKRFAFQ